MSAIIYTLQIKFISCNIRVLGQACLLRLWGIMTVDFSYLAKASDIWSEWRFEPWKSGTAEGLYRRVSMIKSSLMGEVARYYADDYLVWKYDGTDDAKRLQREAKPESDLLVQRYVFLCEDGEYRMKKSSLLFGLRGFVELHFLPVYGEIPKAVEDAGFLVQAAMRTLGAFQKQHSLSAQ